MAGLRKNSAREHAQHAEHGTHKTKTMQKEAQSKQSLTAPEGAGTVWVFGRKWSGMARD